MYYTSKNTKVQINGQEFSADNASLVWEANNVPIWLEGQRHSFDYLEAGGIYGGFSFDYFITGNDPLKDFLSNETETISGNFGGIYFTGGYLESYTINGRANTPVKVQANVVFFDQVHGDFAPTYEEQEEQKILNFSNATITNSSFDDIGSIANLTDLNYSFKSNVQPYYWARDVSDLDNITPDHVSFLDKTAQLSISSDNISGVLPMNGIDSVVSFALKDPSDLSTIETYSINGNLYKKEVGVGSSDKINSSLTLKQNFVNDQVPTISSITSNAYAGDQVTIEGTNFENIIAIKFGKEKAVSYAAASSTQIIATVPSGASTNVINVENYDGNVDSSSSLTVNQRNIIISDILPITEDIGEKILLTGQNFYKISHVAFSGDVQADFDVINGELIETTVPTNAAWGSVSVQSLERDISGQSSVDFVPTPEIQSFSPTSGVYGSQVALQGQGFLGVTNVQVNNLNVASIDSHTNTALTVTLPSAGNINGYFSVAAQESSSAISDETFYPVLELSGIIPSTAAVGDTVDVMAIGQYHDDLMLPKIGTKYPVYFDGVTGDFVKLNTTTLQGLVPDRAVSGPVQIARVNGNLYSSNVEFTLENPPNFIDDFSPRTGSVGDKVSIEGSGFFDVSALSFSGATETAITSYSTNEDGDYINFTIPTIANGRYDITVTTPINKATGVILDRFEVISELTPGTGVTSITKAVNAVVLDTYSSAATSQTANLYNSSDYSIRVTLPPKEGFIYDSLTETGLGFPVIVDAHDNNSVTIDIPSATYRPNTTAQFSGTWASDDSYTGELEIRLVGDGT